MRKWLYTLFGTGIYLITANLILLYTDTSLGFAIKVIATFVSVFAFLLFQIIPYRKKTVGTRLNVLLGGNVLMLVTCLGVVIQTVLLLKRLLEGLVTGGDIAVFAAEAVLTYGAGFLMAVNGFIRIMITSKQLKIVWRVIWALCWWIPPINLFLTLYVCKNVSCEYRIETAKRELDAVRAENEICSTKYPVVLVHGVFFRDWQYFNYWGRIPGELQRNGCKVYYGRHQSAAAVKDSAAELTEQIRRIVEETGCEKVNIIAHSKGGLDARYAIGCLDLAPFVASLTTINTPHRGCQWVDKLLHKLPDSLFKLVAAKYNSLFTKLGDTNPDFTAAVLDLTAGNCEKLNQEIPEVDGIVKQSVMSLMKNVRSASFPLNLGYLLVKPVEGPNDGLVAEPSARWGQYLGTLTCKGTRGISHGDMIDLFRENIKGFDVREYYVMLVKQLKDMGL